MVWSIRVLGSMVCSMNSSAMSLSIPVYDFSMSESVGPFCRLLLWLPELSLGPDDFERLLFLSSLSLALLRSSLLCSLCWSSLC